MLIELDKMKINTVTYEARYDNAYMLWDNAGKIWSKFEKFFDSVKLNKAEPNITSFTVDDKYKISVQLDKFFLIDTKPKSGIDEFSKISKYVHDVIVESVGIDFLTRIGFRAIYIVDLESKYDATKYFCDPDLVYLPSGKIMNIEGKVSMPNFSYNWEGDDFTARILLQGREKKIDFDAPIEAEEIEAVHLTKNELVYDIDYYSNKNIKIGQLNIEDWIKQVYHLVRRDSLKYFGG